MAELDRLDDAAGAEHEAAVAYLVQGRLAYYARSMTRAHASMIPPTDRRYAAAQQVIRYCDEADERSPRMPPVDLGARAVV